MQDILYEGMSNIELYSRLHFLENHTRYRSDEPAKTAENRQSGGRDKGA